MTHCVTNPHLTTTGPVLQIRSTMFFLMFCVLHSLCDNDFPIVCRKLLRQAQECNLLPLAPSVKSDRRLFCLFSHGQPFLRTDQGLPTKQRRQKPWASHLRNLHIGNTAGIELLIHPSHLTALFGYHLCPGNYEYSTPETVCQTVQTLFKCKKPPGLYFSSHLRAA